MKLLCTALSIAMSMHLYSNEVGVASWYGYENKTSSTGAKISHTAPAAAHKTLPIGTKIKITSLKTNKSVVATIVDRGPYTKNRIVDVNIAAAKQLDMLKDGLLKVHIECIN